MSQPEKDNSLLGFWQWFFRGGGDHPGYRRLLWNKWIIFHVAIGIILAFLVPLSLEKSANAVLLPLVGILVGLTFAWAGNALALLQTEEIELFTSHHPGGYTEYIYTFQLAILTLIVTMVIWGLSGLGIFDRTWPGSSCHGLLLFKKECYCETTSCIYLCIKSICFTLSSLALRECWHVVLGAQSLLIIKKKLRDAIKEASDKNNDSVV